MFVAINPITVSKGQGESLEKRFGASEGLKGQPGVIGFELLRRTWQRAAQAEDTEEYLAVTRWETEEHFHAWTKSDAFKKAHGHGKAHSHGQSEQAHACAKSSASAENADAAKAAGGCGGGKMSASAAGYSVVLSKEPQLV